MEKVVVVSREVIVEDNFDGAAAGKLRVSGHGNGPPAQNGDLGHAIPNLEHGVEHGAADEACGPSDDEMHDEVRVDLEGDVAVCLLKARSYWFLDISLEHESIPCA